VRHYQKINRWRKVASKRKGLGIFLPRSKSKMHQRLEKGAKAINRAEAGVGAFRWFRTRGVLYGGTGATGYYVARKPKEKRRK